MSISFKVQFKKFLNHLDWSFFRDSAMLTVGLVLARGMGLVVTMLQARLFNPSDFGVVQYAISVAGIIAIGLQPFGQHVLSRYVGMLREKPTEFREHLSNIWVSMGIIFLVSLSVAIPVLVFTNIFNVGILVIFLGLGIYYAYYGLARGFLASGRLVLVDIGNNLLQAILIVVFIQAFSLKSTTLAMFIQGLACLIPIALLQYFHPLPNAFDKKLLNKDTTREILSFSIPVWVSHASYMLYTTVAVFFLKYFTNTAMVGIFSLASTLSIALAFLPNGLATHLMPKVAGTADKRHTKLLLNALGLIFTTSFVLLVSYYFFAPWLVEKLFGLEYLVFPEIFVLMAIVATVSGTNTVISSVYVGKGRAQEETKSRLAALLVTVVGCWFLIPAYGIRGAVWANLIGVTAGLATYGGIYLKDRFLASR